jgi:hypothetical protein
MIPRKSNESIIFSRSRRNSGLYVKLIPYRVRRIKNEFRQRDTMTMDQIVASKIELLFSLLFSYL